MSQKRQKCHRNVRTGVSRQIVNNFKRSNEWEGKKMCVDYFDDYLGHLGLYALQLQSLDGRFRRLWRFKVDETVALAFIRVLVQDRLGRDDRSEPDDTHKKNSIHSVHSKNSFRLFKSQKSLQ